MGPGFDTFSTELRDRAGASEADAGDPGEAIRLLRDEVSGLRESRASRAVIEQAKGVLMATTGCSADEAFVLLRRQSQHQNRRVRDIAEQLVAEAVRRPVAPDSAGDDVDVEVAPHRGEGPIQEA